MTHPATSTAHRHWARVKPCLLGLLVLGGMQAALAASPKPTSAGDSLPSRAILVGTLYDYRNRDLRGLDTTVYFPFDFGSPYGETPGLLERRLSPQGRPIPSGKPLCIAHPNPSKPCEDPRNAPDQWFQVRPGKNLAAPLALELESRAKDSLVFADTFFFPLDTFRLLPGTTQPNPFFGQQIGLDLESHNFGFCMELHGMVEPKPSGKLTIEADDDTWVFVDGELSVDMGGLHPATSRRIPLEPRASASARVPLDIFHCERMPIESMFAISLDVPVFPPDSTREEPPISGRLGRVAPERTLSLRSLPGAIGIDAPAGLPWTLELRGPDGRLQRSLEGAGPTTTDLTISGVTVALLRSGSETATGRFVRSR